VSFRRALFEELVAGRGVREVVRRALAKYRLAGICAAVSRGSVVPSGGVCGTSCRVGSRVLFTSLVLAFSDFI